MELGTVNGVIADMLRDAAAVAAQEPEDIAQGLCTVTLTNGQRITGRVQSVDGEAFTFGEGEHDGPSPDYMLFVRMDHVVTFQYCDVPKYMASLR